VGAGIEAGKTLFSKNVKLVKVVVKAGYRVLLYDEKANKNKSDSMKKFIVILLGMLSVLTIQAQNSAASDYTQIRPEPLTIAVGKTTHLIYPFAIKSVDRGSRDILVQKAKGLENILQVKAARECLNLRILLWLRLKGSCILMLLVIMSPPSS
jgi:hypothetical protein